MAQAFTPGIFLALAVVAAIIFGSYWLVKNQERPPRRSPSRRPDPQPLERPVPLASRRASDVLAEVKRLHASQAGWNDIFATLNPGNDRAVLSELQAIRGPHMFAPELALQVLESGCAEALRRDPRASAHAGFLAAREGMEKVTRYGD